MIDLKDKVVLVTGGARDIGRAVSLTMAECGAHVSVNWFDDAAQGEATVAAIRKLGRKAVAVCADVTREEEVQELVARTREALGGTIDVLVNVVGGLVGRKRVDEMDMKFWNTVMDVNMKSTFLTTRAVLPHMPEGGAIINFASQAGHDGGGAGAVLYAATKGGVMSFTRGMAKELGARRIRVNCVAPGMIATSFHDTFTKTEVRQKVAAATPLGREGRAEEVARVVAFLASEASSFINGACIDVNGGAYLG